MDPISNTDRLVLILRQRLKERAKTGVASTGSSRKSSGEAISSSKTGVRGLVGVEGVEAHVLHRALIQDILADQLGTNLVNDAQFQQVVSQVTEVIEADPAGSDLLARLISDLRGS
jgi:hypothetical protein